MHPATPLGWFLNGAAAAEFAQIFISLTAVDAQIYHKYTFTISKNDTSSDGKKSLISVRVEWTMEQPFSPRQQIRTVTVVCDRRHLELYNYI